VVLVLAGVWETQDIERAGRWTDLDQPEDQRYVAAQLRRMVRIASAHGARVELSTMVVIGSAGDSSEAAGAGSPRRRAVYDRLVRQVAAEFPRTASVLDYGGLLSPGGVYEEYLDGVQVRSADGVHTPAYSPGNVFAGNASQEVADAFYDWLSPRLWPRIVAPAP
jgi:hypothetical protein